MKNYLYPAKAMLPFADSYKQCFSFSLLTLSVRFRAIFTPTLLKSLRPLSLFVFSLLLLSGCSAEMEKPELGSIGDSRLQISKWRGWAILEGCYYHNSEMPSRIVYLSCPEGAGSAQDYLLGRENNAFFNVDGARAGKLSFVLAYSQNEMTEYSISFSNYSRSDGVSLHEGSPVQILLFDSSGLTISPSGDITELGNIRMEQQPETLFGSMRFRLINKYPTIDVPVFSRMTGTFQTQTFNLYFIFSFLLERNLR